MDLEERALTYLSDQESSLIALAQDIWEHPQVALQELYAVERQVAWLEQAGFAIERQVSGMPAAFVASWGEGQPTIGLLGEYDALPGLSQKVSAVKEPVEDGGAGHACGHNLLGVAALGAALAVKDAMERAGLPGTIRYYGCPAEETLVGKVFMARAGAFDDLDAALTWHPGYPNAVSRSGHTAMNSFRVNFHGVAAHAAGSPEMGRSALDGVQLMDVGVNYLREHILQDARIHCVITDGGRAPNIVPAFAQVWYYVRSLTRKQVEDIYARVLDIAKGAALMSGTTYDVDFITGCYEVLPNETLGKVLQEKLKAVGPPHYTEEEKEFARQLQATTPPDAVERSLHRMGATLEQVGDPLSETIVELTGPTESRGSTDVGDVSHVTPTAQITACCQALGTPGHSWQFAASSGSSIGHKGMMVAARTLALAALELETRPELLQEARAEFVRETGGKPYVCAVPEGVGPR